MHYDYNQKTQSYDFCENQLNVYIVHLKFSLIKNLFLEYLSII